MSLSSSIYIGTTGVIGQQEKMSVISDNLANMNTVGYKASELLFDNLISEQLVGATVNNQIGMGVGISSIRRNMDMGGLETTTTATDMAINGHGYFMVSPQGSDDTYYTKAGNFRFDVAGYLRDPQGNILQGYKMPLESALKKQATPAATSATLEDIQLRAKSGEDVISQPEATSEIRLSLNLNSAATDKSTNATSPFTALFDKWDASLKTPLAEENYSYQSALKIYDASGQSHTLTAYFDPASDTVTDTLGSSVWEFLLTIPPTEDTSALSAKKGILMAGTMTFTSAGELENLNAFQGTSDDKNAWTPVGFSQDGFPLLSASFTGAEPISAALDLGLSATGGWTQASTLGSLGTLASGLPGLQSPERNALATTNYGTGSATLFQTQNGYPLGHLQTVFVDTDGVLAGRFSNGQEQGLFKIPLADFINPQGLFREGGNLFSAQKEAGKEIRSWAGEGRRGVITGHSLEMSNVDMGTEMVNMILTQRGLEANSKAITTGDQTVQTAIQMKR